MTAKTLPAPDWKVVPLGHLLQSVQSGFASGARDSSGVIQMRMNNVTTDGNLDWTSFIRVPTSRKQLDKYHLRAGDVLFNNTNSPDLVGKTAIFDGFSEPVVFSNHFIRLRVDETQLDPRYLGRWLTVQWQQRIFEGLCTQWVNQASVRKDDLLALEIPLPPLPEQQCIAAILTQADRLRRLRRAARELSDTYLQAVFLEMFGDPVSNPKRWDMLNIGNLAAVKTGGTPNRANKDFYEGHIPWVKTTEVIGSVIYDTEERITQQGLEASNCEIFPTDTILVAMYGQGLTRGRSAKLGIQAATNQACAAILPSPKINTDYLWSYLKLSYHRLRDLARGGNQPNLNLSMVRDFAVPFPPLPLQQQFAAVARQFDRLRARQREAERQAEHLFQTLLGRAFRGKLTSR